MSRKRRKVIAPQYRRDRNLIPRDVYQLNRINRMLKQISKFPMYKKQAD